MSRIRERLEFHDVRLRGTVESKVRPRNQLGISSVVGWLVFRVIEVSEHAARLIFVEG